MRRNKNNNSECVSPTHYILGAVLGMGPLLSPSCPEDEVVLLLLLENLLRDTKPTAEFHMLPSTDPGCDLKTLAGQGDAGRAESWPTP